MIYLEAIKSLGEGATFSCSFGYSGEDGYSEYWRTPDGRRWNVSRADAYEWAGFTVKEVQEGR